MPTLNKLTATQVKAAKARDKSYSLPDGGGLVMTVRPTGARWWRFRYRFAGIAKMISFGVYPDVSLEAARTKREAARKLLAADPPIDPSIDRQARKAAQSDFFKVVAAEWFKAKQAKNVQRTKDRNQFILDRLTDRIGKQPMGKIDTPTMIRTIKAIQSKNGIETARRALGIAAKVFSWAIANGKAERDPTQGLKEVIDDRVKTHRASIIDGLDDAEQRAAVGELMRAIDGFSGQAATRAYLQLLAMNFCRPTELRLGQWSEIDLDAKTWLIPASRMKASQRTKTQAHLIPLSTQSIDIMLELKESSGSSKWVFPTASGDKPISMNAGNNALQKVGYDGTAHTCHGFRALARTLLDEQLNFRVDVVEHQLGHTVRDANGRAYNRTKFVEQRRTMLQAWADFLDVLKQDDGEKVVPILKKSA